MSKGDFSLDGIWYKAKGLPQKTLANQMASKVGQGTSGYGDLTSWSAWIQEDWQDGSGNIKPHLEGGMLYGEVESRVPGQLILPGRVHQTDTNAAANTLASARYMPSSMAKFTMLDGITNASMIVKFKVPNATTSSTLSLDTVFWFYIRAAQGQRVRVRIFNDAAGAVGTEINPSLREEFVIKEDTEGYYWHGVRLTGLTIERAGTNVWVGISPCLADGTLGGKLWVASGISPSYAASSQVRLIRPTGNILISDGTTMMFTSSFHAMRPTSPETTGSGFYRHAGKLWCYVGAHHRYYVATTDSWVNPEGSTLVSVTTAVPYAGSLFLGSGNDARSRMIGANRTLGFVDTPTHNVDYFLSAGGYLYFAVGHKIWYVNNPNLTTAVSTVDMSIGETTFPITGMASLGEEVFISTTDGLYRVAPGDFVVGVAPWDSPHPDNGRSMVNHLNALYITANNRIIRYTPDGTMQDVWLSSDADLIEGRLGKIWSLVSVGNWLFALVAGDTLGYKPTIWALQDQNWHHIATLPEAVSAAGGGTDPYPLLKNYSMYYDRETKHLWAVTPQRIIYKLRVPPQSTNPYNDPDYQPAYTAWAEWDWWDGSISEAIKDIDSIAIMGDNMSNNRSVTVYWKDDTHPTWQELGVVTTNYKELRFSSQSVDRPATRRFKLGFRMQSLSHENTPRIRAIRMKYQLMIQDWFRWSLTIDVAGRTNYEQEMPDGTRHTLTGAQLLEKLDGLAAGRDTPFIYRDVDGREYEVKVQDANFTYTRTEYNETTGDSWWEGVYRLTVEAVTSGEYVA